MVSYDIRTGVKKIKTKTGLAISAGILGATGLGLALAIPLVTHAESMPNINFESSQGYTVGDINGQNGWSKTGAYDAAVVDNTGYGYTTLGTQSLRISNAVTSGSFGDQTFSPPLLQSAGETGALDKNGNPVASPQPHFEAQFDIASTTKAEQPGMALSVSPDGGAGTRMSYLRFQDQSNGIHVYFDDVEGVNPGFQTSNFVETDIATLSYTAPHTIKFSMDFLAGPSNDVVRIYIDGNLVKTGTSWENYYRYDTESNSGHVDVSRTVDSLLFREGGSAVSENAGKGYLIDNVSYLSGSNLTVQPTSKDQCKNNGWMQFNNPSFKNQGQCEKWVEAKATGNIQMANPSQQINFNVTNEMGGKPGPGPGPGKGKVNTVEYWNFDYPGVLHYTADVTCSYVNPDTKEARFMFQIPAGHTGLSGLYVVAYVKDVEQKGVADLYGHAATGDLATATQWCQTGVGFSPSMYTVTKGKVQVN